MIMPLVKRAESESDVVDSCILSVSKLCALTVPYTFDSSYHGYGYISKASFPKNWVIAQFLTLIPV